MDVSEMCIDTSSNADEENTSESRESSKRKFETSDVNEYQQQYQLQHRYLKSYQDYIEEEDPIPAVDESSKLLKELFDKCSLVYQQIGKYRQDPLREAERNQIIDQVYFTAESMLKDLDKLRNQDTDYIPDEPSVSSNESTSEKYKMIRQARNLQKSSQPKYKRRSRNTMIGHRCHSCNTTDTPEWRRGPDGARTLCNACGLHYSKLLKKGSLTIQTHNYMETPPTLPPTDSTKALHWNF